MRRVENKPLQDGPAVDPTLLDGIKSEVTNETRPFLQFILSHSRWIIGVVVVLLLALAGTGIYNKVMASQEAEVQEQLAKIRQNGPDAAQLTRLEELAGTCPSRMRLAVYTDMAASALAQGNFAKASEAYGVIAREAADTPMGRTAALNQAGTLMAQGKYAEGVKLLESLVVRLPAEVDLQARLMLAEGAVRAGQYDLAARTYEGLASNPQNMENGYYLARATAIRAMAGSAGDAAQPAAPAANQ